VSSFTQHYANDRSLDAGEIGFRPWEQIFYGGFDGNRRERVLVKIIGE